MRTEDFSALLLARFELRLRACQGARLPGFLGSTLRGAFGHALKQAICVVEHGNCAACPVAEQCWYPYLFETAMPPALATISQQQDAPRPFILVPPLAGFSSPSHRFFAAGEELCFRLTLLQEAQTALPYLIYAIAQMAQHGLGVERARFALEAVASLDAQEQSQQIYSAQTRQLQMQTDCATSLQELIEARLQQLKSVDKIKLRFVTPTRIRIAGQPQPEITFPLLIRFLLRRISLVFAVHCGVAPAWEVRELVDRAAAVETLAAALPWQEVDRYSNRQQRKVKTSGFTGEIVFAGERIAEFLPLLVAGEYLHVGSNATFGLGKYEIVT
jgi:CRISPR/Cas system endoribonuclease Cas6 (RAMP superfamily)